MSEWWTYTSEDLLLFSPRTYWRMFELHNQAIWPLQIGALLLGAALLVWVVQPRRWSDRAVAGVLAAAWIWVGWSFLWNRYSAVNWAVAYAVPVFVLEALLLLWIGCLPGHLRFEAKRTVSGVAGLALFLYALVLHPFVAKLAGRPIQAAEVFGIAPDPTAIATIGLVSMASGGAAAWLLLVVPSAWCIASWATLFAMGAGEGWIPLAAVGFAVASRLWHLAGERTSLAA